MTDVLWKVSGCIIIWLYFSINQSIDIVAAVGFPWIMVLPALGTLKQTFTWPGGAT